MAKPLISLNDIALRWHDRILFEGLSWDICSDQHWAVVGPNGSGQSTLMGALRDSVPIVKGRVIYHFAGNGRFDGTSIIRCLCIE